MGFSATARSGEGRVFCEASPNVVSDSIKFSPLTAGHPLVPRPCEKKESLERLLHAHDDQRHVVVLRGAGGKGVDTL